MFRNTIKILFRILKREKLNSAINIGGLTISFVSCFLIFHFLNHELSYDRFHENKKNIYRINMDMPDGAGEYTKTLSTQPALVPVIRDLFPQIEHVTRLRYVNRILLTRDDRQFYETKGYYADSSFLDIFSFKLMRGDRSTALNEPNSVIMTEKMAVKYFPHTNPIGQTITLNNTKALKVTGILEPVPSNSHLQFDFLISFSAYELPQVSGASLRNWRWLGFLTYVELTKGADADLLRKNLDKLLVGRTELAKKPYRAGVQPLDDIYLGSGHLTEDPVSTIKYGSKFSIYAFVVIACLILAIAGFNFMNLTTALYMNRVKEVGLRKILGAEGSKIVLQLLTESMLITMISMVLAVMVYSATFEYITRTLGWSLTIDRIQFMYLLPTLILLALIIGVFTGMYPSVSISQTKATSVLNRNVNSGNIGGITFRNILIVLQFATSICLIIATMVITRQISYLNDQSLGFNQENVVTIKLLPEDTRKYYESFKNALIQHHEVISVSKTARDVGNQWPTNFIYLKGQTADDGKTIQLNWVDYDYFKTMGISFKEGRAFSKEHGTDSSETIILNQKAVELLELEDPVGTEVFLFGERKVIGVTEDFNFSSLHNHISPAAIVLSILDEEFVYVRVTPGNISHRVALLKEEWEKIIPEIPLDISFMDLRIEQLYVKERKLSGLITIFSGMAILLACLGLYGLVSIMVSGRIKEVSIRKVLGANIFQLMYMISKKYFILILVANGLAWPIAFLVIQQWLESFAYRIDIGWHFFIVAATVTLLIALLTIGTRIYRTSKVNPVDHFKDN